MLDVSIHDRVCSTNPTSDFLKNEILRVGASAAEIRSAMSYVSLEGRRDPRAYDALSPRLRRLVDLAGVAGAKVLEATSEAASKGPAF